MPNASSKVPRLIYYLLSSQQLLIQLAGPDAGERAFILEGEILNQNMEPIIQCQACEEYFRDASRRILLIKNNVPIRILNTSLVPDKNTTE